MNSLPDDVKIAGICYVLEWMGCCTFFFPEDKVVVDCYGEPDWQKHLPGAVLFDDTGKPKARVLLPLSFMILGQTLLYRDKYYSVKFIHKDRLSLYLDSDKSVRIRLPVAVKS